MQNETIIPKYYENFFPVKNSGKKTKQHREF